MQTFPLDSNKQPACESWKTYEGEVNTPMFGLTPPAGFYVIDVDSYKDEGLKEKIEQVLGCSIDWDSSLIQTTLNGGTHHAFIVPQDVRMKQDSDVLGVKGFDTRASGRGYIASGEGYTTVGGVHITELFDEFDLPDLPSEAVKLLSASTGVAVKNELTKKMRNAVAGVDNLTPEIIEQTLLALPEEVGTDNSSWMTVCAGLKRQMLFMGKTREQLEQRKSWAYARLSKWSYDRFDGDDADWSKCESSNFTRWCSFGMEDDGSTDGNIITFKTVMGMVPSADKPAQPANIMDEKREKAGAGFVTDYVMDAKTGRYIHRGNLTEFCRVAFDSVHIGDTPLNTKGKPEKPSTFAEGLVEVVSDVMYAPSFGRVFTAQHDDRKYLNTYRSPRHIECGEVVSVGALERVKDHVAHLVSDSFERDLILYYLAHNIQKPGHKIPWGIILQGTPGDGKSFFAEMMMRLMGMNNVRVMNADTLQSSFTGWAAGQCMVFIEELKLDNFKKYEIVNRVKPYISNPTVEWTRKGKDPLTVPNTSNYFCFTNHKDAIPIDDTDRRYAVIFSRWQGSSIEGFVEDNANYYPNLYNFMRDNVESLYCEFMALKIPDWFNSLTRAPQTAAKQEMIALTRSAGYKDMVEAIDDFPEIALLDDGETLNITALYKYVVNERIAHDDDTLYANLPDPVKEGMKLNRLLTEMGWTKNPKRRQVKGVKCSTYCKV